MRSWIGYAATATVTGCAMAGAIIWQYGETLQDGTATPPAAFAEVDPTIVGSLPARAPAAAEAPGRPRRFPPSAFSAGEVTVPPPTVKTQVVKFGDAALPPAGRFATTPGAVVVASAGPVAFDPAPAPTRRLPSATLSAPDVVDARTLAAGGRKIRLAGLALPPADRTCRRLDGVAEPCRDRAKTQLELHLRHRTVVCTGEAEAARCRIGNGDVGEWLVRSGWMLADAGSDPRLQKAAAEAKRRKLGMWR